MVRQVAGITSLSYKLSSLGLITMKTPSPVGIPSLLGWKLRIFITVLHTQ